MDDTVRAVAWAIAEAWWRRTNRRAAGAVPEADTSEDYANAFWQGFVEEARAAIAVIQARNALAAQASTRPAYNRFA